MYADMTNHTTRALREVKVRNSYDALVAFGAFLLRVATKVAKQLSSQAYSTTLCEESTCAPCPRRLRTEAHAATMATLVCVPAKACAMHQTPLSLVSPTPRSLHCIPILAVHHSGIHSALSPATPRAVKASFVELYNEELTDLLVLGDDKDRSRLRLMEDRGGVVVQGLDEIPVKSIAEVFDLLDRGTARRRTAETHLNKQSSRSHSIFSVIIQMHHQQDGTEARGCGKRFGL